MMLKSSLKHSYRFYARHVGILLPLMIFTGIGLFLDKIPYLNLFKEVIFISILMLDWFAVIWLSKISTSRMIVLGLGLYAVTIPLHYLKLTWYTESLGTLTYIVFITIFISEFIKMIRHHEA